MRKPTPGNLSYKELPPGDAQTDTPHLSDGLVAIARAFLSGGGGFRPGSDREMIIHVDASVLAGEAQGRCEIEGGSDLHLEAARRIACDCKIAALLVDPKGRPISIGRKSRVVPSWLRKVLSDRDRGCRFPGCWESAFVEAHHIRHWIEHGETALDNLIQLCFFHHRMVHDGGYNVKLLPSGNVEVRRSDGTLLEADHHHQQSYSSDLRNELAGIDVKIAPDALPDWSQQHANLGDIVASLFVSEEFYDREKCQRGPRW